MTGLAFNDSEQMRQAIDRALAERASKQQHPMAISDLRVGDVVVAIEKRTGEERRFVVREV